MKTHLANVAYDVLDYDSYPIALVLMVSIIPHKLRASEFRSWMIATAVMGASGTLACISLTGRSAMLLVMSRLLHGLGPRGLPIARALYGATVFSPYLPPVSWRRAEITERHCVSCIAIPYEVREGSQS